MKLNPDDFEAVTRIAEACFATETSKGWNEDQANIQRLDEVQRDIEKAFDDPEMDQLITWAVNTLKRTTISEKIALTHSELSEGMEDLRNKNLDPSKLYFEFPNEHNDKKTLITEDAAVYRPGLKPVGFPSEVVDAIIRLLGLCVREKIDVAKALRVKMEYNELRPYRHGGKQA